jgi:hypothetical protein
MAAYIGKIEAFDETIEPWSSYVERLGQYFKIFRERNHSRNFTLQKSICDTYFYKTQERWDTSSDFKPEIVKLICRK